jgi:hypothetical protein
LQQEPLQVQTLETANFPTVSSPEAVSRQNYFGPEAAELRHQFEAKLKDHRKSHSNRLLVPLQAVHWKLVAGRQTQSSPAVRFPNLNSSRSEESRSKEPHYRPEPKPLQDCLRIRLELLVH